MIPTLETLQEIHKKEEINKNRTLETSNQSEFIEETSETSTTKPIMTEEHAQEPTNKHTEQTIHSKTTKNITTVKQQPMKTKKALQAKIANILSKPQLEISINKTKLSISQQQMLTSDVSDEE